MPELSLFYFMPRPLMDYMHGQQFMVCCVEFTQSRPIYLNTIIGVSSNFIYAEYFVRKNRFYCFVRKNRFYCVYLRKS